VADLLDFPNLVSRLAGPWGVEGVAAGTHGKGSTVVGGVNAVEAPAADHPIGDPLEGHGTAFTERQLVNPTHHKHIRAVIAGHRTITIEGVLEIGERETSPAVVVAHVDRL